jgi:hypothetical protein
VAKKNKPKLPEKRDMSEALSKMEQPKLRWKTIAQIALAFGVVWLIAAMLMPYIGIWGLVAAGLLTAVALGFGFYIWRLTRKSSAIMEILKGATDDEGRKRAIQALQAGGGVDAM